ncbi:2791_t:CDS:1, partial [Funneliformis mosseae]
VGNTSDPRLQFNKGYTLDYTFKQTENSALAQQLCPVMCIWKIGSTFGGLEA